MTIAWSQVAAEAIEHLTPFGPVILMGLESVRRHMGRHIERRDFVTAKSVYALLKATFERAQDAEGQRTLEQFVKEPDQHQQAIIQIIADRAERSPGDFGRKLVALTNRWREDKRPLPPAE